MIKKLVMVVGLFFIGIEYTAYGAARGAATMREEIARRVQGGMSDSSSTSSRSIPPKPSSVIPLDPTIKYLTAAVQWPYAVVCRSKSSLSTTKDYDLIHLITKQFKSFLCERCILSPKGNVMLMVSPSFRDSFGLTCFGLTYVDLNRPDYYRSIGGIDSNDRLFFTTDEQAMTIVNCVKKSLHIYKPHGNRLRTYPALFLKENLLGFAYNTETNIMAFCYASGDFSLRKVTFAHDDPLHDAPFSDIEIRYGNLGNEDIRAADLTFSKDGRFLLFVIKNITSDGNEYQDGFLYDTNTHKFTISFRADQIIITDKGDYVITWDKDSMNPGLGIIRYIDCNTGKEREYSMSSRESMKLHECCIMGFEQRGDASFITVMPLCPLSCLPETLKPNQPEEKK